MGYFVGIINLSKTHSTNKLLTFGLGLQKSSPANNAEMSYTNVKDKAE